ncbi:MAG: hypothetical protein FGM43_04900 [Sinobacteraceae bacterium]|nr:hypothetical protein [Nevskiaceae bacterium]
MLNRSRGRAAARWLASFISLAIVPPTIVSAESQPAAEAATLKFRVNGVPLHAKAIRVSLPQQVLTEALLREWSTAAAGPSLHVETSARTILGRQVGFLHETITLKVIDAGHTEVHMAVRDLRQPVAPQPRLPFTVPRSFALLSVVEQGSEPMVAQTFSLAARDTASSVIKAVDGALRTAGWSVSPAFRAQTTPQSQSRAPRPTPADVVLWASRNDRQLQVVIVPSSQGSTVIVQVSAHAP